MPCLMWRYKIPGCKRVHPYCNELPSGHDANVARFLDEVMAKHKDGG